MTFKELDKYYDELVDRNLDRYSIFNTIRNHFLNMYLIGKKVGRLRCAEIGVFRGNFSKKIIEFLSPEHLYLIDIWEPYNDNSELCKETKAYFDYIYNEVNNVFSDKKLYTIMKMTSKEASYNIPDNSLDFIYIDANHEDCLNDLTYWFPKLNGGGVIAGHDYWGKVKDDVDYFFKQNNKIVYSINSTVPQWYYIKNDI